MADSSYLSIVSSNLLLAGENEEEKQTDPLAVNYPTWSSRWKSCQAYLCFSMSFLSILNFCESFQKFGFAVIIPYIIFTCIIGVPAVLVEVMFGRYGAGNVQRAWDMCPPAKGVFICLIIVTYSFIVARSLLNIYSLKYFISSFYGRLQWESCDNSWTKENCFELGESKEAFDRCLKKHSEEFCKNLHWESSGYQFWKYVIINKTSVVENVSFICCLLVTLLIIFGICFRGIHSFEKALGLLFYPVLFMWAIFAIVSLSIPNALYGFQQLCYFSWNEFTSYRMWIAGLKDVFYCFGLGSLSLSFISCHGKFTDDILFDVLIITFVSLTSSLMFTIPFLGAYKYSVNKHEKKLLLEDDFEIIIIISEVFIHFPYPNVLWVAIYFLNAFLMSVSSEAISVLAVSAAAKTILKLNIKEIYCVLMVCAVSFVLAIAVGFTMSLSAFALELTIWVNILLYTVTWQIFYGISNFKSDYHFMMGYPVPLCIRGTWITLIPLLLTGMVMLIYFKSDEYLKFHLYILSGALILIYIFNIIYQMIMTKKRKGKMSLVFTANPDWGPENPLLKKSRKLFGISTVTREFTYRQELHKKPLMKPPDFSLQNIVYVI